MQRRDFISSVLLGGVAAALPFRASAQQPLPVIGFLHIASSDSDARVVASFRQGLNESGYIANRNVTIKFSWAEGRADRLPELAAELVRQGVTTIVAMGGSDTAKAAKAATSTIPIVFVTGPNPVDDGLVASLARPGGNLTGINWIVPALEAKRLELLHAVVPKVADIAMLMNPKFPDAEKQLNDAREAARQHGVNIQAVNASTDRELDTAFETLGQQRTGALLMSSNPYFFSRRRQLLALAGRYAIPTIYDTREYPSSGGLMSYGSSLADAARLAGGYTGRILKGQKPGDLPILQPAKFEFVINLKTAIGLDILVPPAVLESADEVFK
jgi:putative ABC transport system substrate-binding protein